MLPARILVGIIALFAAACPAQAAPPSTSQAPAAIAPATLTKIDADAQALLTSAHAPGATIAIVEDGKLVYVRGYGERDMTAGLPADPETRYEIGSITKQFTAAAIVQLKEIGKVDLDAPLSTYLPKAPHAKEVTIRELLTHTSGLHDYMDAPNIDQLIATRTTFDQLMSRIANKPPDFKPGAMWAYSNTNYIILGRIIEVVSGQSWYKYVKEHLFLPAGMTQTSTIAQEAQLSDMARGYTYGNGRTLPSIPIDESWGWSAGAIVTTVGDLAKWNDALTSGRIISAADYRLLITPQRLADGSSSGYGFGMYADTFEGQPRIWHNGNTYGFDASDQFFPTQHVQIVVLTNAEDGGSDGIVTHIYNDLFPRVANPEPSAQTFYSNALKAMEGLPQPPYATYTLRSDSDTLHVGFLDLKHQIWLDIKAGSMHDAWQMRHRTDDYETELIEQNGQRWVSPRSFFDPTWYGAFRALRAGMFGYQNSAAPVVRDTPPPATTLKTIAVASVMGPNVYTVYDRGAATCANGDPGHALHLVSRDHDPRHQLTDVVVDLHSMRFCSIRFDFPELIGFRGVLEQHYAQVGGYWVQTDGFLDGNLRVFGISTHHGFWRYRLANMQFPSTIPADAFIPSATQ